jgi:hypothetical protein
MNNPNAVANLTPFRRGFSPNRRSRDVERCLKLARRHCPEAVLLLIECMRDAEASWPERIKAAQGVLNAGLPKDPAALEKFFGDSGGTAFIEVRFVAPGERSEPVDAVEARPNGNGTFSVEFDAE